LPTSATDFDASIPFNHDEVCSAGVSVIGNPDKSCLNCITTWELDGTPFFEIVAAILSSRLGS
jgi:hypothetical protein